MRTVTPALEQVLTAYAIPGLNGSYIPAIPNIIKSLSKSCSDGKGSSFLKDNSLQVRRRVRSESFANAFYFAFNSIKKSSLIVSIYPLLFINLLHISRRTSGAPLEYTLTFLSD